MAQACRAVKISGSYQRRWSLSAVGMGLAGLLLAVLTDPAAAEESRYDRARREHPALFKLYYDEIVIAYCGLATAESEAGFRLERDALLAADPLSAEAHRTVRVASDIAADYAYQDHGLSGQKRWCGTEGRDAYDRFVTRPRAQPESGAKTE
jgi:hypothetical protein